MLTPFIMAINTSVATPLPNNIGYARLSSVGQNIDSQTDALQQAGCFLSRMGTMHRVERALHAERAAAARASAKALGKSGGQPPTDPSKLETAKILSENSGKTSAEVCKVAGVGRPTFFAYLAEKEVLTSS